MRGRRRLGEDEGARLHRRQPLLDERGAAVMRGGYQRPVALDARRSEAAIFTEGDLHLAWAVQTSSAQAEEAEGPRQRQTAMPGRTARPARRSSSASGLQALGGR